MFKTRLLSGILFGDHCTDHGDYGRKPSVRGSASDQPDRNDRAL